MPTPPLHTLPGTPTNLAHLGIQSRSMSAEPPIRADSGAPRQNWSIHDWGCPVARELGAPCAHCRPHAPKTSRKISAGRIGGVATDLDMHLYDMGVAGHRGRCLPEGIIGGPILATNDAFASGLTGLLEHPLAQVAPRHHLAGRKLTSSFAELMRRFVHQPRASAYMAIDGVEAAATVYTMIVDPQTNLSLDVLTAHNGEEIVAWFRRLPNPEDIRVVIIDPSVMERAALRAVLPKEVEIWTDPWHILNLIVKAMHAVRKHCGIKGERERLTPQGRKVDRLSTLMGRSGREVMKDKVRFKWLMDMLKTKDMLLGSWQRKEDFLANVHGAKSPEEAAAAFGEWRQRITPELQRFFAKPIKTIGKVWWKEFLASFGGERDRYGRLGTNGAESLNRRLKVFVKAMIGEVDPEAIRLRMLFAYGGGEVQDALHKLVREITAETAARYRHLT